MPIYAYKCESCGHSKDVLQKLSDAPLTQCPSCGAESFRKQLTAAGFQLKGSGWYVTDFRDGGKAKAPAPAGDASSGSEPVAPAEAASGETGVGSKGDAQAPAASAAPAPAATSAAPAPAASGAAST